MGLQDALGHLSARAWEGCALGRRDTPGWGPRGLGLDGARTVRACSAAGAGDAGRPVDRAVPSPLPQAGIPAPGTPKAPLLGAAGPAPHGAHWAHSPAGQRGKVSRGKGQGSRAHSCPPAPEGFPEFCSHANCLEGPGNVGLDADQNSGGVHYWALSPGAAPTEPQDCWCPSGLGSPQGGSVGLRQGQKWEHSSCPNGKTALPASGGMRAGVREPGSAGGTVPTEPGAWAGSASLPTAQVLDL